MTRSTMLAATFLVAFAACKKDQESAKDKDKPSANKAKPAATSDAGATTAAIAPDAAPAAPPPAPVDAAPAATPPPPPGNPFFTATAEGIGPITAKVSLSEKSLAKILPDYKVKKVIEPLGDDLEDEFYAVSRGDTVLLKIHGSGNELLSIEILTPEIELPHGIRIGATHADISATAGPLECSNAGEEADWRAGVAMCITAKRTATASTSWISTTRARPRTWPRTFSRILPCSPGASSPPSSSGPDYRKSRPRRSGDGCAITSRTSRTTTSATLHAASPPRSRRTPSRSRRSRPPRRYRRRSSRAA